MSNSHESYTRKHREQTSSDFSFALTFSAIFLGISAYGFLKQSFTPATLIISALFGIIAVTRPSIINPLNKVWAKLGLLISYITQPILMFILFYVFLTPIAVLFRIFAKKDLHLRFDKSCSSYWIKKTPYDNINESMKNQF